MPHRPPAAMATHRTKACAPNPSPAKKAGGPASTAPASARTTRPPPRVLAPAPRRGAGGPAAVAANSKAWVAKKLWGALFAAPRLPVDGLRLVVARAAAALPHAGRVLLHAGLGWPPARPTHSHVRIAHHIATADQRHLGELLLLISAVRALAAPDTTTPLDVDCEAHDVCALLGLDLAATWASAPAAANTQPAALTRPHPRT